MAIIFLSVGNVLPMQQPATTAAQGTGTTLPPVESIVSFAQSIVLFRSPLDIVIGNILGFAQSVNYNPKPLSPANTLSIQHTVARGQISILVNSYLAMWYNCRTVLTAEAGNTIVFSHTNQLTNGFSNAFAVNQIVTFNIVKLLTTQSSFGLNHGVGTISHGHPEIIPVPVVPSVAAKLRLQFGSWTLVLDAPLFDDVDEIEHLRINRNTRAGERIVYRDPTWPIIERLTYHFDNLSEQQRIDLLNFIDVSLGRSVVLTDYNSIQWNVILTNPDVEIAQLGRCSFEAQLEFEGSRV